MTSKTFPLPTHTTPAFPALTGLPAEASPEISYAALCQSDPRTAYEGGVFYRWTGDYWRIETPEMSDGYALSWLAQFDSKRATAQTAKSCVTTALLMARKLPPKPDDETCVIPVPGKWLIVKANGGIQVVEPDRSVGVTYRIAAGIQAPYGPYTPAGLNPASMFAKFLVSSLPDKSVREFVQEYIGYTLMAGVRFQMGMLWVGQGSNGKSVMLNIVRALHEKSVAVRLDKLDGFDLEPLIGCSLAYCDEAPKYSINQQALKSLISGGAISVNRKYRSHVNFMSSAKFIVCSNHMPSLGDQSDGWWRRFSIVEWNETIKGQARVPDLDKLIIQNELPAVIDWALEGLQRLLARGDFTIPELVATAKKEAMENSSSVAAWCHGAGVARATKPGQMVAKAALFATYREYCEREGLREVHIQEFFTRLRGILGHLEEDRPVVTLNGRKERARRLGIVLGQFSEVAAMTSEDDEQDEEDFDPFSEAARGKVGQPVQAVQTVHKNT